VKWVEKGESLPFDILLATPNMAPLFRPFGRILGPKGLMPNEKRGTIVDDFTSFKREEERGIPLKLDGEGKTKRGAMVRIVVGKVFLSKNDLTSSLNKMIPKYTRIRLR